MTRTRSRETFDTGFYQFHIFPDNPRSWGRTATSETCVDVVDNKGGENPFALNYSRTSGGIANGSDDVFDYSNVPYSPQTPEGVPSIDYSNSKQADWTRFLSVTNPSRPEIQLAVSLFELKDIPRMVRQWGRYLNGTGSRRPSGLSPLKDAAAANLALQFGWVPLLSDILKLVDFQKAFDRRRKEIDSLHKGNGMKRRMTLFSHVVTDVRRGGLFGPNSVPYPEISYTTTASRRVWATVRWKPDVGIDLPPTDSELQRAMLGLHVGQLAPQLWEALPWSWLIDWFSNTGSFLSANNNSLGASPQGGCLMDETKEIITFPSHTGTSGGRTRSITGIRVVRGSKNRSPSVGLTSLSGRIPIVSGKQLSILASLAVLRV